MSAEQQGRLAIALKWDGQGAPLVAAKGYGAVAEQIAALALTHDVPINCDPALAELLACVDVDAEIPEGLFVAVAEVIAFAYRMHGQLPQCEEEPA